MSEARPPLRHRLPKKPQAKRAKLPAPAIADVMGLIPAAIEGQPERRYGKKALPGQYVKPYTRLGHLPLGCKVRDGIVVKHPTVGRISKGMLRRYVRDHGSEGRLDMAESINARR